MFANSSDGAFTCVNAITNTKEAITSNNIISELIIKGAGFYFLANADINYLSEKIEISDLYSGHNDKMLKIINQAIWNMKKARYYYGLLVNKTNQTPYNEAALAKLMTFDYDSFQEQNGLLKEIFAEVKSYLATGDVRGIYSRVSNYFDTIIESLETIKIDLEAGKIPANNLVWNLNQLNAKTHMFGQYTARVFEAIK
jgi:hypothetical protein